jgi:5,10-methylenetetrahydromethanopterin reductase
MARPFRISVMQPTMEPIDEIIAIARTIDRYGFHAIWMAENYPWWRKHSLEARSASPQSALVAHETKRVAVGWGIISPYTRHPIEIAMEARVMQEIAGPDRFIVGLGASKIFMHHIGQGNDPEARPVAALRESVEIIRGVLAGDEMSYEGKIFSAFVPALPDDAVCERGTVPVYLAGTGPQMQRLAGKIADGLLTASITTPAFVEYSRQNMLDGAEEAGRSRTPSNSERRASHRSPRTARKVSMVRVSSLPCIWPIRFATSREQLMCSSKRPGSRSRKFDRSPMPWTAADATKPRPW